MNDESLERANAFLDGLAHRRERQGRPALSINWGLWGAWLAMFFDVNLRAVIAYARFRHGGWTKKRV